MLSGHIGVFGLQSAILCLVPKYCNQTKELGRCVTSLLVIVTVTGMGVGLCLYGCAGWLGEQLFQSEPVREGIIIISPAIILFSVNKFLTGYINGLGHMKKYAIIQGSRYFFLVFYIAVMVFSGQAYKKIFYAFGFSEIAVLVLEIGYLWKTMPLWKPSADIMLYGIEFGFRAMLTNVLNDINTRIDILMLGFLCSDEVVGTYSYVSIIAEGIIAVLFVFRNNYNPVFAQLLYKKEIISLKSYYLDMKKKIRILMSVLGAGIILLYVAFCFMLLDSSYLPSVPAIVLIVISCVFMAPYFTAGNLCTLNGKPQMDTLATGISILCNVLLDYFLVHKWGIIGAALATGISFIIFSVITFVLMRKYIWNSVKVK